jgi:hypothetical protein
MGAKIQISLNYQSLKRFHQGLFKSFGLYHRKKIFYYCRLVLAAIFVGCFACKSCLAFPQPLNIAHSQSSSLKVLRSKVKLVPAQNTDKDPVYGILSLVETSEGVYIQVRLLSLFKVFLGCLRTVCFTDFLAEMVF